MSQPSHKSKTIGALRYIGSAIVKLFVTFLIFLRRLFWRKRSTRPIYWIVATVLIVIYFTTDLINLPLSGESVNAYGPVSEKVEYPTGSIAGNDVGNLYARYIGHDGIVPDTLAINYSRNLERLWDYKVAESDNSVVRRSRNLLLREYQKKDPGRMSLQQYKQLATKLSRQLHQNIDWRKVGEKRLYNYQRDAVNQRKLDLLRSIANSIEGRSLLAYGLTELMPTADGPLNRDFLDFLLRTAGRRFVESIPAIHDSKTSFGLFQFTEHALYDLGPGQRRGASVINEALPKPQQVPGSVIKLRGNDHLKAAWLNAVNNLAMFIRYLTDDQMTTLENNWRSSKEDLVQLIANAHHGPPATRNDGELWLDNGSRKPFVVSTAGRFIEYAEKTRANYRALR
jgi:hypothetical protein